MIKLNQQPERFLEVRKPDGDILKLKLRSLTVRAVREREATLGEIYKKYKVVRQGYIDKFNSEINSVNFLLDVIGVLIEDYDREAFDEFTVDDLGKIREELERLSVNKDTTDSKKKA